MVNKLIEKHLSYQDYNEPIINLDNGSTSNQQKMNTDTGYLSKIMAIIIHTCNGTTASSRQSFYLFQMKNNNSTIAAAPQSPILTSLEEAVVLGYIQKPGDPAQGGTNPNEIDRIC